MDKYNVAADGRISKLEVLDAGPCLCVAVCLKMIPTTPRFSTPCMRMANTIKGWKATLRKEKTKQRMKRMVELSPSHHTLDKVDDMIIQSEAMYVEGLHQSCRQMPTLCRYKTTGNTSTGGCDPKPGHISVLNQQQ